MLVATHSAVNAAAQAFVSRRKGRHAAASPMRFRAEFKNEASEDQLDASGSLRDSGNIGSDRQAFGGTSFQVSAGPRPAVRRARGTDNPGTDTLAPFLRRQAKNCTRADALIADALGLDIAHESQALGGGTNRLVAPSVE